MEHPPFFKRDGSHKHLLRVLLAFESGVKRVLRKDRGVSSNSTESVQNVEREWLRRVTFASVSESELGTRQRLPGYDGALSAQPSRRGSQSVGNLVEGTPSPMSISGSFISYSSEGDDWDIAAILSLTDSVRTALVDTKSLGADGDKFLAFLDSIINEETRDLPTIDFEMLEEARLDLLLSELLLASRRGSNVSARLRSAAFSAITLQKLWRNRFKGQYFSITQHRVDRLVRDGRLKDVSFVRLDPNGEGYWKAKNFERASISELEAKLQFEAGHWWLNIACAHRDGIVGSEHERLTTGTYGIAAVPFLTGDEESIRDETVKYTRQGEQADMHAALIPKVGSQIRLLRGHRLKSICAPVAGVRYDGLYTIRKYRLKLDEQTDIWNVEIVLDRVHGQRPFDNISTIPKPSQLDDWHLYELVEGEKIKQKHGDQVYLDWTMKKEVEKVDREHAKRAKQFLKRVSTGRMTAKKGIVGKARKASLDTTRDSGCVPT